MERREINIFTYILICQIVSSIPQTSVRLGTSLLMVCYLVSPVLPATTSWREELLIAFNARIPHHQKYVLVSLANIIISNRDYAITVLINRTLS